MCLFISPAEQRRRLLGIEKYAGFKTNLRQGPARHSEVIWSGLIYGATQFYSVLFLICLIYIKWNWSTDVSWRPWRLPEIKKPPLLLLSIGLFHSLYEILHFVFSLHVSGFSLHLLIPVSVCCLQCPLETKLSLHESLLDMLTLRSASEELSRLNFFILSHGYIWPDVHSYPTDGCAALVTIPLESAQSNEPFYGEVHLIPKWIFKLDWINVPHSIPVSL